MALSRELMLGMLRRGNTGDQLMQILDLIVSDVQSGSDVETVEGEAEIEF